MRVVTLGHKSGYLIIIRECMLCLRFVVDTLTNSSGGSVKVRVSCCVVRWRGVTTLFPRVTSSKAVFTVPAVAASSHVVVVVMILTALGGNVALSVQGDSC